MILKAMNLKKKFSHLQILNGVDLCTRSGESVAIMGPSGSGKSTLLHILGLLDRADEGSIELLGQPVEKKSHAKWRNQHIGFIFQAFHLLEEESVLTNVLMPAKIARRHSMVKALELIANVGLNGKEDLAVKHLSGGEKQRCAIARALCNDPELILADEPTGNLDSSCSEQIHQLLFEKAKDKSLVIVTHDQHLAERCDRILYLDQGHLVRALESHPL